MVSLQMPASTWKILTLKLFALRPNCLLLARSDIRVVLQHPGQVLIVSLKPSLFLRGRLFPSLNGGLQEKVKTEMTATQSSDTGRIYERCSRGMQGFVTFPLFLNPTSHTHTNPQHTPQPQTPTSGFPYSEVCVLPPGKNGLAQQLTTTTLGTKWVKREAV